MQIKTISKPREVIIYSGISPHFPPCDVQDISQVEIHIFRRLLGWDFYKDMLSELVDYSGAEDWEAGDYTTGDVVKYKDLFFVAVVDTSSNPDTEDWRIADKFNTECYNDLYSNHLARYIALRVLHNTIPLSSTPITAQGVVKRFGDNFQSAEASTVSTLMKWVRSNEDVTFDNMIDYMAENEGCYPLWEAALCGHSFSEPYDAGGYVFAGGGPEVVSTAGKIFPSGDKIIKVSPSIVTQEFLVNNQTGVSLTAGTPPKTRNDVLSVFAGSIRIYHKGDGIVGTMEWEWNGVDKILEFWQAGSLVNYTGALAVQWIKK